MSNYSVREYRNMIAAGRSPGFFEPFLYDVANEYESALQPATVHETNTIDYHYFFRYFMQELFGLIQVENWPETWNKEFFLWNIICRGWIAIVNSPSYGGWIPQPCVWGAGRNVFQFPTSVLVQNGYFNPEDGRVEFNLYPENIPETKDTIYTYIDSNKQANAYIIKITPDYCGLADICAMYAGKCASLFATIDNSAILSRNGYILETDSKAESMTVENAVKGILNGEIIVSIKRRRRNQAPGQDEKKVAEIFESDVRKHYVVTDALEDLQTIVDMFHSAIGFPVVNRAKKERIIQAEQAALNTPASVRPDLWERSLSESISVFNKGAGYDIRFSIKYQEEGEENGNVSEDTVDQYNAE